MKCDVLIIGAGPAGSTAAKFLSEKGVDVILLDKEKFPRDKPCGGGIPLRVFDEFNYIKKSWIESYSFNLIAFSSSLDYKIDFYKEKPLLAMVLREKFDYELVKHAIDKGAKFIQEKAVKDLTVFNDKVSVLLDDESTIESKIVIGADGVFSTVAKKIGLKQNPKNICMCAFEEYKIDSKKLDEFFSKKRYSYNHVMLKGNAGYFWVFPKKEHLNIGVTDFRQVKKSTKNNKNLKELYIEYIKILKENKIIPQDLEIKKIKGAPLPICPLKKTYSKRIILCGDAAGFASPATGEGIYYAMRSGKIAANVICEALKKNDTSEKFLSNYQKIWYKDFGRDLKLLLRLSYLWGTDSGEIFRLVSKDKKLTEIVRDIVSGEESINKLKLRLATRYIYIKLKDKFKK